MKFSRAGHRYVQSADVTMRKFLYLIGAGWLVSDSLGFHAAASCGGLRQPLAKLPVGEGKWCLRRHLQRAREQSFQFK